MWNKTIHIVHRNKSINLTGEDGFKRFLRVNSLKKMGRTYIHSDDTSGSH